MEQTVWRMWGQDNLIAFFKYETNGLKLMLENRILVPLSNAL